jgi:hypothetical protein
MSGKGLILHRRHLLGGLAACGCVGLVQQTSAVAQSAKPFCSFSLDDGWSSYGSSNYVNARRPRPNDPSGVPQIIAAINDALGISPSFDVYISAGQNNASASVANGRKILMIDVDFLEGINRMAGTEWGAIQVIAHEVGHHIAGFLNDRLRGELNADYWSGQALQRLGSSRESAQAAIMAFGGEQDSSSHPNKYRRAQTIARGWDDARRDFIDRTFCDNQC